MLIIGITGTRNLAMLNAARYLVETFHLCNVNLKQPVINRLANEIDATPHEVVHFCNPHKVVQKHQCTLRELEKKYVHEVQTPNKNFLIECAEAQLEKIERNFSNIFSGALITGISQDHEAEWLRNKSGHLIHLIDTRAVALTERVERTDLDTLFITDNAREPIRQRLCVVLNRLTNPLLKKVG